MASSHKLSGFSTSHSGKPKFGKTGKMLKNSTHIALAKKKSNNCSTVTSTNVLHASNNALSTFEQWDCPLCMEQVDLGDVNFVPCECGYQICRFCWHHIKFVLNDLCPACRRSYSKQENSPLVSLKSIPTIQASSALRKKKSTGISLSPDQIISLDNNGTRGGAPLGNVLASRKHLIDVRVLQSNLVYVVGIPLSLSLYHFEKTFSTRSTSIFSPVFISALEELLASKKYFGNFGHILKLVINIKGHHSGSNNAKKTFPNTASSFPTVSAFLTFEKPEDASTAIDGIDNSLLEGCLVRATYGTTKYCAFFLRGQTCPNQASCLYLHELGKSQNSYTKESLSHRQRDISLKRLFGVSSQTDDSETQRIGDTFNQDPDLPCLSNQQITDAALNINSIIDAKCAHDEIDSTDSGLLESTRMMTSTDELQSSSISSSRSSSRFNFVADLGVEPGSTDLSCSSPSFPISDLFESFKSPTLFSPLDEEKSLCDSEGNTPQLWCPFENMNTSSMEPLRDQLDRGLATFTNSENPLRQKLVQPSYSAAAKSGPLNSAMNSFESTMKKPLDYNKGPSLPKHASSKKANDFLQKSSRLKTIQLQGTSVNSTTKKDIDYKQVGKEVDSKPIKLINPLPVLQENAILKPSNPFMFLAEEEVIDPIDNGEGQPLFLRTNQLILSTNSNAKISELHKNQKKKKKSELKNEIDDQFRSHLEYSSDLLYPQARLDYNHLQNMDTLTCQAHVGEGDNFDLHKTFSSVLTFLDAYIISESERIVNTSKYHHLENDDGDIFSLDSTYGALEPSRFDFTTEFTANNTENSQSVSDSFSISNISSELLEFDRLVGTSNMGSIDILTLNCDPATFYSIDSYLELETYRYSLPKLLDSFMFVFGKLASNSKFDTVSFSKDLENDLSNLKVRQLELEKTLKENQKFIGSLVL